MVKIRFQPDGSMAFVYEDAERTLGRDVALMRGVAAVRTRRASHVEPNNDGRWTADMTPMGGPTLGPFDLRGEALEAEHRWLDANL